MKKLVDNYNIANNDEILEDTKDKIKIDFYTAYVELVDGKYDFYRPKEDMREGQDCYTGKPLYGLESNQFYAIVMKCRLYNYLNDECLLDIESEVDVFYPKRFEQEDDDSYLFLFQDFYNFQYERSKLYSFIDED